MTVRTQFKVIGDGCFDSAEVTVVEDEIVVDSSDVTESTPIGTDGGLELYGNSIFL